MRPIIMSFIVLISALIGKGDVRIYSSKQNDMSLELKIDIIKKPQIGEKFSKFNREKLIIGVKLFNKTNQNICVESIIKNATLNFIIKDENNNEIQKKINIVEPQINADYYKVIKPFKEYKEKINLLDSNEYIFKAGNVYYITAVYSSENPDYSMKNKVKVFDGQLHSNTLELKL